MSSALKRTAFTKPTNSAAVRRIRLTRICFRTENPGLTPSLWLVFPCAGLVTHVHQVLPPAAFYCSVDQGHPSRLSHLEIHHFPLVNRRERTAR